MNEPWEPTASLSNGDLENALTHYPSRATLTMLPTSAFDNDIKVQGQVKTTKSCGREFKKGTLHASLTAAPP